MDGMRQEELAITGMTCDGCVRAVQRALSRVPGVTDVAVDLAKGRAVVDGDAAPEALVAALERAGYGVRIVP
jgi:copper chaperone CopZ